MPLQFAQPYWIIIGLIACLLVAGYLQIAATKRRRALALFAAPRMCSTLTRNVSHLRRKIKNAFFLSALLCCFFALARPQYGEEWIEVKQKGIDILIGVDTSQSMLVQDIQPNRLQRAKLAIKDFVTSLTGDRIGLMPFAGTSFLICPLTTDYAAFNETLDTLSPESIPLGGTNLAEVITSAGKILAGDVNHKILILVTDGEDLKGEALKAAQKAADQKMTIYTVGVGTPEGELIPDTEGNQGAFIKDGSGNFVRSRLDETTLTKIAEITNGLYVPLGNTGQGFATIYQQKLELVPKEEHQERMQSLPIERFYWPLTCALVLLVAEFLLSGRKPTKSFRLPGIKTAGRRLFNRKELLIVLLFPLFSLPGNANGLTADELFRSGAFAQAEQEYTKELDKEPGNAALLYNLGGTQYKQKEYAKAIASFDQALQTDDLGLQAKSYYNLGNARYRLGQATLQTDTEHTLELYQQAIAAYEGSLALNPDDKDASYNLDLVQKELDKLKQQQQEKNQQEQNNQENNKNQDKEQQDTNGEEQQQDEQQDNNQDKQSQEQSDQGAPQESSSTMEENSAESNTNEDKQDDSQAQNQKEQEKSGEMDTATNGVTDKQEEQDETAEAMSSADKKRREQGKMTVQEADSLLDALQEEEGRLDFVPQNPGNNQEQPLRNW